MHRQTIREAKGSAVNYWKPVGIGLLVIGAVLAVYGLSEYLRMANAPCLWAALCLAPDAAIFYLIVPGVALAICGAVVFLAAPKKVRPVSPS